jgi:hypothetical protein
LTITPAEFMSAAPRSMDGNNEWASRYARELRGVITRAATLAPRSQQVRLGPSELGVECLAWETEVVTRQGIRKIGELADAGHAEVLVPLLYQGSDVRKTWGKFAAVPVRYFGTRELTEVTLRRGQEVKVVRATAGHAWFRSYWSGKQKKQQRLTTMELRPGHKLCQLRRAMPHSTALTHWAVAQGFTFGDGTRGHDGDSRYHPATLNLYHNGKDRAVSRFFPGFWPVYEQAGHEHPYSKITGLPRSWKELPPLSESASFLLSWLAGYFAADGSVGEDGHCSISSAYPEHLEFVRSTAAICGVGYGQVQKGMRRGISGTAIQDEETPLYKLSLRRRDLPAWFFLNEHHAQRAAVANEAPERDPHWTVESVIATGSAEPVFCATVDGVGAFGLADDLMTGNCDRQVVGKLAREHKTNNVSDPWPSIVGTAVHAWLAGAFGDENMRENLLRWVTETAVAPHPDYPGHSDLYDAIEHAVVDWKVLGATSLAKVKSAAGPSRKYRVQLVLYGIGFRALGLPVRRVVLAALPRTASTLDGMYVWDHVLTPEDDAMAARVIERTGIRKLLAAEVAAGRMTLMQVPASPDDDECYFCVQGSTEVVTREGIRQIGSLAGTSPELLVPRTGPAGTRSSLGTFQPVPVRSFGYQRLWRITLSRGQAEKVIEATAEHGWYLASRKQGSRYAPQPRVLTHELRPGDQLQSLRAQKPARTQLMPPAVAQGFTYGDGARGQGRRPATLCVYDKSNGKDALLPFFPMADPARYPDVRHIYGLPRFWKDLPPVTESRTFLLSWLAGYFAADGTVSEDGQCSLSSASWESVMFTRDVAAICGIRHGQLRTQWRLGTGTEKTAVFTLTLRRRDLPDWFFLLDHHRQRAQAANQKPERETCWTVVSVEDAGRTEEVFCAVVPGAEAFALAGDLMTSNCPFYRPQSSYDHGPGCPGTITR